LCATEVRRHTIWLASRATRLFSLVSGPPCFFPVFSLLLLFFVAACSCAASFVYFSNSESTLFPTSPSGSASPKTPKPPSLDALWLPTLFTLQTLSLLKHPNIPRRDVPCLQRCPRSLPRPPESNSVATTGSAAVPLCPRRQSRGFSPNGFIFQPILEHKSTFNTPRTVLYKRLVALGHWLSLLLLPSECCKQVSVLSVPHKLASCLSPL